MVLLAAAIAVVGPLHRDQRRRSTTSGPRAGRPSAEYPLGTTTFGQDVLAQFVHGMGATLLVGLLGGGLAALVGMTVGFMAGYRGGWIDEVLTMITNVVLVIPTLVVLLLVSAYLEVRGVAGGGDLHRAHLVAMGGARHPGPDVLALVARVRGPRPPVGRQRAAPSSSARSRPTWRPTCS